MLSGFCHQTEFDFFPFAFTRIYENVRTAVTLVKCQTQNTILFDFRLRSLLSKKFLNHICLTLQGQSGAKIYEVFSGKIQQW